MKKVWKKDNNKTLQKDQIKTMQSFSIPKNKNWKKQKWEARARLKKKHWRGRIIKRRKILRRLKKLKKFRFYENLFNSQFIKKKKFLKKIHYFCKIIKAEYSFKYLSINNFWKFKRFGEICRLTNNIKLSKNKKFVKKKLFFIKKCVRSTSKYFFKRLYKKKTNYKFNKQSKPFLLKSIGMCVAKFSLMDNYPADWYSFNGPNQSLTHYAKDYSFEKSRQIKFFFDMLTQKNLFMQIKNIKILRSHFLFQRIHKQKIFSDFLNKKRKFPWWEVLMFKQQTYSNRLSWKGQQFWFKGKFLPFSFKFYYKYKKPWREKKKFLYSNFSYLIFNTEHQNLISNKKKNRIKELLNKVLLPFYGNIKPQQIKALYKKNHYVKSKRINSSDLLLNNLENRLDVIIYRLNLAPSIIWARRLIKAGLIFLQRTNSKRKLLVSNYFQKKTLYPLQLNKRFDLYDLSEENLRIKKFTFKTQPIIKINFPILPGDIIQCHPFSLYQKWNVNDELLNKPIPPYLLTKTKIALDNEWNPRYHYIIRNKEYLMLHGKKKIRWKKNFNFTSYRYEWKDDLLKETTSFFLFTPQKKDFLLNDRNSPLFLNWIIK